MPTRSILRRLGLGRAIYRFWHAPVGALKTSIAAGRPIEQWRDRRARGRMRAAASRLEPQTLPAAEASWPEVHFLTGAQFWDQTALCLLTLQAHAGCSPRTVFHDDGSASDFVVARLGRVFPLARWRRPAGATLRKFKAWFTYHPWTAAAARVRYAGACGHFDGRVVSPHVSSA